MLFKIAGYSFVIPITNKLMPLHHFHTVGLFTFTIPINHMMEKNNNKKNFSPKKRAPKKSNAKRSSDGKVRLNRFLAQAGICSRREADNLISMGLVMINDKVVTELGTKVDPKTDKVKYDGREIKFDTLKYFVLNKPKDFITTSKDPQNRKTVMHLIENACIERIYPVGRLDRNTLGVLLFTNDGNLAEKLTHPRNNISKTYLVELNKKLEVDHSREISNGIELEDGQIQADDLYFPDKGDRRTVVITIHSGKNRIVRRIFEHFDYQIKKLDRIDFAGITKKNLKRGQWRELDEKEVGFLKLL